MDISFLKNSRLHPKVVFILVIALINALVFAHDNSPRQKQLYQISEQNLQLFQAADFSLTGANTRINSIPHLNDLEISEDRWVKNDLFNDLHIPDVGYRVLCFNFENWNQKLYDGYVSEIDFSTVGDRSCSTTRYEVKNGFWIGKLNVEKEGVYDLNISDVTFCGRSGNNRDNCGQEVRVFVNGKQVAHTMDVDWSDKLILPAGEHVIEVETIDAGSSVGLEFGLYPEEYIFSYDESVKILKNIPEPYEIWYVRATESIAEDYTVHTTLESEEISSKPIVLFLASDKTVNWDIVNNTQQQIAFVFHATLAKHQYGPHPDSSHRRSLISGPFNQEQILLTRWQQRDGFRQRLREIGAITSPDVLADIGLTSVAVSSTENAVSELVATKE